MGLPGVIRGIVLGTNRLSGFIMLDFWRHDEADDVLLHQAFMQTGYRKEADQQMKKLEGLFTDQSLIEYIISAIFRSIHGMDCRSSERDCKQGVGKAACRYTRTVCAYM